MSNPVIWWRVLVVCVVMLAVGFGLTLLLMGHVHAMVLFVATVARGFGAGAALEFWYAPGLRR